MDNVTIVQRVCRLSLSEDGPEDLGGHGTASKSSVGLLMGHWRSLLPVELPATVLSPVAPGSKHWRLCRQRVRLKAALAQLDLVIVSV